MALEGFTPYDKKLSEKYVQQRWWLGITLGDMLDKSADLYPSREALVGSGKRYTYAQLRHAVDRLAHGLLRAGFVPGERVLLQIPNWPEFVISYFALQKAGLVMVLLTTNHTAREISHLADVTRPTGWIVPARYRKTDFIPLIGEVKAQNADLSKIIIAGNDAPEGYLKLDDLMENGCAENEMHAVLKSVRPDPADVCQILPSGGTTGLPKGAPRTHNDYICNVEYTAKAWDINATDTCLVATTVGHNLALLVSIAGPISQGAKIVMLDSNYPADFCKMVQQEEITCAALVPTLISRIVNFESLGEYDLSALKKIYVGAANSPKDLVQKVEVRLGAQYVNAFGMVEGPLSQTRLESPLDVRCNTIGRPCCPYDEIKTFDVLGVPTPVGVEGELAARGPGIFTGYFRNPQANKSAFTPDGFFRSGDLAITDIQGNIRITGRIKDIIIRGGENIGAQEVEELISTHPSVEYAAVVGMPDADLGEKICAYIKPVPGRSITHEDLVDHMKKTGANKALLPERTEILDHIPKTAAGKADKKVLRQNIIQKLKLDAA